MPVSTECAAALLSFGYPSLNKSCVFQSNSLFSHLLCHLLTWIFDLCTSVPKMHVCEYIVYTFGTPCTSHKVYQKNFYLKVFKVFSLYPPPSLLSTLFFVLSPPSIFPKHATWSHDPHPASVLSFATVLCHVILGCLTFHFPSRVHCDTEMSSLHFIHGTFPRHFQHLILALYS